MFGSGGTGNCRSVVEVVLVPLVPLVLLVVAVDILLVEVLSTNILFKMEPARSLKRSFYQGHDESLEHLLVHSNLLKAFGLK